MHRSELKLDDSDVIFANQQLRRSVHRQSRESCPIRAIRVVPRCAGHERLDEYRRRGTAGYELDPAQQPLALEKAFGCAATPSRNFGRLLMRPAPAPRLLLPA